MHAFDNESKLSNIYIQNININKINNDKCSFLFILCVTYFSINFYFE